MPRRPPIVEDETPLCSLLRAVVTASGHAVTTAADGRQGWERLAEGGHDLVLANAMLPYPDRHALLARLRAFPALRRTPVVPMSANQPATVEADGVAALVANPFDLAELLATIARAPGTAYPRWCERGQPSLAPGARGPRPHRIGRDRIPWRSATRADG